MRILHVIDQISQKTAGGSAKVCFQMAEAQAKLGHDVTIYTTDYGWQQGERNPFLVGTHKFHCLINLLGGMRIAPTMYLADFRKFDVIHLHNYRTFVNLVACDTKLPHDPKWTPEWMKSRYVPIVLQAHGSAAPLVKKHWTQNIWRNGIMNRVDACIADAPIEESHYKAEGFDGRIETIPVGIDLSEFKDLPERKKSDKFEVLYLGRIHPIKGIELLIQAVSQCSDVHLTIAGNAEDVIYLDSLKTLVVSLRIADRVSFVGALYGKDKVQAYVDADLYAMTSHYEMWGVTYMEAMACGTPVLMTDKSEMAKLLPVLCGSSVSADVESIAKGIGFHRYYQTRGKDIEARQKWVSQYDWSVIALKIVNLYEELIRGN